MVATIGIALPAANLAAETLENVTMADDCVKDQTRNGCCRVALFDLREDFGNVGHEDQETPDKNESISRATKKPSELSDKVDVVSANLPFLNTKNASPSVTITWEGESKFIDPNTL